MPSAAEIIRRSLGGRLNGKRCGMCRCPAHDDKTPSLSVTAGDDGAVLVLLSRRMQPGSDVIDALQGDQDLWPELRDPGPAPGETDLDSTRYAERRGWLSKCHTDRQGQPEKKSGNATSGRHLKRAHPRPRGLSTTLPALARTSPRQACPDCRRRKGRRRGGSPVPRLRGHDNQRRRIEGGSDGRLVAAAWPRRDHLARCRRAGSGLCASRKRRS